jgi:hypothetical protein
MLRGVMKWRGVILGRPRTPEATALRFDRRAPVGIRPGVGRMSEDPVDGVHQGRAPFQVPPIRSVVGADAEADVILPQVAARDAGGTDSSRKSDMAGLLGVIAFVGGAGPPVTTGPARRRPELRSLPEMIREELRSVAGLWNSGRACEVCVITD